ncbi:SH3 domain-containing protein [Tenacibaculum sp. TC6]|uniref:SH3 domain-containing protein n=1 Tax=Tenacibaculum sp. TC6 TaxID=3423223 RepID=UPI003D368ABD
MKKIFIAITMVSVLFTSCKENGGNKNTTEQTSESNEKEAKQTNEAICLLEKLSVRETPQANGKWITSMSLGEKVILTGEETTDDASKKLYYKVKLIDGKEGWTRASFLGVNGEVGVLLEDASMYKRPDLLTKTDKKYSTMDIIAVLSTQGDWVQIKGKRAEGEYIEEGWIKTSNISNNEVDIATAKYAALAVEKETMTERIKALQEIIENPDLSSSDFINVLKERVKDYESKNMPIDVQDAKAEEESKK